MSMNSIINMHVQERAIGDRRIHAFMDKRLMRDSHGPAESQSEYVSYSTHPLSA